jgi:TPR repeat protein
MDKNFLTLARSFLDKGNECEALACYIAEALSNDSVGWTLAARLLEASGKLVDDGVPKIFREQYIDVLESRSELGDLGAMRSLIGFYEFGMTGFDASPEKAISLLLKLAKQGDINAQFELFEKNLYGLCDLPQDKEIARYWLEKAASSGHEEACEWLSKFKAWDESGFIYPRPLKRDKNLS